MSITDCCTLFCVW